MIFLLLSVLCSTLIYSTFKLFERFGVRTLPAIVVNYWVAFAFGAALIDYEQVGSLLDYEWLWLVPIEGVLFISIFNVMAMTVQHYSVAISSVASRIAMIIPAIYFMYRMPDEGLSVMKVIGIILALVSVYFSTKKAKDTSFDMKYAYLPVILFIGSGLIDLIIGHAQEFLMSSGDELLIFTPGIFFTAAIIGSVVLIIRSRGENEAAIKSPDILGGLILGLINYASIYFIMKAMDADILDSSVFFPVNHIGIIALSTLVGVLVFKERLRAVNWAGIAIGLTAIIIMTWA